MARRRTTRGRSENRYADAGRPQREIDLHFDRPTPPDEVRRRVADFIDEAIGDGIRRVRIITGKGKNSKAGPRVKPAVEKLLWKRLRNGEIKTFYPAKATEGGDGAFDVELSG